MINNQKEVSLLRFDASSCHETNEDFSLPDYMPEVRRIINCSAVVLPENKYIDRDEVTLSGIVSYTVLYVGDNEKICSVPLNSEYSVKLSCTDCDMAGLGTSGILSQTSLEACGCRATGPRKLALSSKLRIKIFSSRNEPLSEKVSATQGGTAAKHTPADELTIERKSSSATSSLVLSQSMTGSAAGEIRVTGEVISCFGTSGISDTRYDKGDIRVYGDVYLSVLVMGEDGNYSTERIKSTFEEKLQSALQGSEENTKKYVSASSRCAGVSITPGEEGAYNWNMEYDIDVTEVKEYSTPVTKDIYSTAYHADVTTENMNTLVCLKNGNSRLTVSAVRRISGEGEKYVGHVSGKASIDRAECSPEGKLTLSGNCNLNVITVGGGEIITEEMVLPVKFECDCKPTVCKSPSVICDVGVLYADARIDKDRLSAEAELCISIFAGATEETRLVSEFIIDRDRPAGLSGNCVKIYFPEDDEDMWDIGKKYHCEVKNITPHTSSGGVIIAKK